ncbi:hypothetical protein AEQ63_08180 [Pseudomonas sp. RIT-PI-o]|nr:hypothetical protein AEQ63_08180 [Pseudomonas sp. RIT-PI-o]
MTGRQHWRLDQKVGPVILVECGWSKDRRDGPGCALDQQSRFVTRLILQILDSGCHAVGQIQRVDQVTGAHQCRWQKCRSGFASDAGFQGVGPIELGPLADAPIGKHCMALRGGGKRCVRHRDRVGKRRILHFFAQRQMVQ